MPGNLSELDTQNTFFNSSFLLHGHFTFKYNDPRVNVTFGKSGYFVCLPASSFVSEYFLGHPVFLDKNRLCCIEYVSIHHKRNVYTNNHHILKKHNDSNCVL